MAGILVRGVSVVSTLAVWSKTKVAKPHHMMAFKNFCVAATNDTYKPRKYTEKHEWIAFDGEIGTVGISDYAQDALGDVVYVELPDLGKDLNQSEYCGLVESVKAVSEMYTPVSGKVIDVNELLLDQPSLVNKSCYNKGYMFKLELSKKEELESLMDEEAYQKYIKTIDN